MKWIYFSFDSPKESSRRKSANIKSIEETRCFLVTTSVDGNADVGPPPSAMDIVRISKFANPGIKL
jgi:hypothetical protein